VDRPLDVIPTIPMDAVQESIGCHVAGLVEDGDCLQMGIGGLSAAVLHCLRGKRDLGVHSEMFSDGLLDLIDSGIVNNDVVRLSNQRSIFHYARDAGLSTAAAAYHWVSELYNRAPFQAARDRHTSDEALPIQHGHFYYADHYPDSHLFADADSLRQRHQPNLLLVHPMNIDDAGHKHGLDSSQYRNAARMADVLLAEYIQTWLDAGYQILVTADHGMNNDRSHNGVLPEEREVPLIVLGSAFSLDPAARPQQTELCGTICQLLGAAHDKPWCRELLA
jgi:predicted AlkP superfamily pyrophosphatase or phosphodiesterase